MEDVTGLISGLKGSAVLRSETESMKTKPNITAAVGALDCILGRRPKP